MLEIKTGNKKLTAYSCMEHANRAKACLDRRALPDSMAVNYYMEHLQDCYDCPTLGFLANKYYYNSPSINFPSKYVQNRRLLECDEEIIMMHEKIRERINNLYPRTKYIRQYIINDDRLSLYYVKPSRGYNFWDKFKISAKIFTKNLLKGKIGR